MSKSQTSSVRSVRMARISMGVIAICVVYFFGFHRAFAEGQAYTGFLWLVSCWQFPRNDLQHGWLIPMIACYLAWRVWRRVDGDDVRPTTLGLVVVVFGLLLYLASVRTLQPRLMILSFPLIVFGGIVYMAGWRLAIRFAVPVFLIGLAVPMPGILQATNQLQVYATTGAYRILGLLGIETVASGNFLKSPDDSWGFDIAEGCSGIRSLLALSLIAIVYAEMTLKQFWQKIVLFVLSVPLAVFANMLRVASIVVVAKLWNPDIAGSIYHDYSGFIFFPIGLLGVIACGKLLACISRSRIVGNVIVRRIRRKELG